MTDRRVYLTSDGAGLRELADRGILVGSRAFAVTQPTRDALPAEDEESLEYDAFVHASRAAPGRAVVVAADLDEGLVHDGMDALGYVVSLTQPVSLASVVSIHVAEPDAGADEELLWYDVSELYDLVASWPPEADGHTLLNHS